MARIEDLPLATPVYNDIDLFADISDSNNAKSNTIGSKVKAGLADPTVTADDLQDGTTKKVLTAAERIKLAGIQAGAQVNTVTSVNGQMGIVVLDADDIADTATRKMGNEIFNTSEKNKLDTAYTHSQAVTGNPHNVTAAQVGLGNVANERQLSRTAGNFNALPLKTDIQRNMNDLVPIQDAFDNDIIKKVTVGTQYIRYSSTIQLWRPSVNYHADTLVNSTTYEIRNIVIDEVTGGMYYCTISHQSGANFASDLALGLWTPVLAGGGGASPVYVIRGASNPTQAIPGGPRTPSGAFAGQLFANTVTADILVRDGNDRVLNSAGGGGSGVTITVGVGAPVGSGTNPGDMYIDYNTANIYVWNGTSWVVNNATGGSGSGIIYSLANGTVVASTTGDRGLASTGTGADKTYETSQEIDPLTGNTINMNFGPGGTVVFDDTDINFENGTTLNYDNTVVSNHNGDTVNYDGSTINSTNTEYNHTGDTINYDATTTVDGGTFVNNEFNNPTFTGSIGLNVKYKNAELSGQIAGATYTLPTAPSGDIQVSIKSGVIQSEITPDYTHTANATTFTMVADRTGHIIMVSYIEAVMSPSPSSIQSVTGNIVDNTDPENPVVDQIQADRQQSNNALPDFVKNKVIKLSQIDSTAAPTINQVATADTVGDKVTRINASSLPGSLPATFTVLGTYTTPTGGGLQAVSQSVPSGTKIINMYSATASGDVSGTLYRGGAIQTLLQQPGAGATGATWDILLNTLSGSLFIPGGQNYTFEYLS